MTTKEFAGDCAGAAGATVIFRLGLATPSYGLAAALICFGVIISLIGAFIEWQKA